MKKNKGITLVALVVTIIILIILALVTINLTIGNNGLITRAKEMQNYMTNAQISDEELINQILEELEEEPENPTAKEKLIIKVVDKVEAEYGNIIYIENVNIGIYTDASCTNLFKEIEIKNGIYETNTMPAKGTYFVKVKEAPPAYNIPEVALEFENKDIDENIWTIGLENNLTLLPSTGRIALEKEGGGQIDKVVHLNIQGDINIWAESKLMIWKIADYNQSTDKYVYTDDFAKYPVEDISDGINKDNVNSLGLTLESYICYDNIIPERGVRFGNLLGNDLDLGGHGIYLMTIEQAVVEDRVFYIIPLLFDTKDEDGGNYTGDLCSKITIDFGLGAVYKDTNEETESKTYRIKWEDEGHESERPVQLTANLYQNMELCETFNLGVDNYWSYTVKNLSIVDSYKIAIIPATNRYTVSIKEEINGITYIILKYNP